MRTDNPGSSFVPDSVSGYPVCNLCEAVADGNATCWACVDRWVDATGTPFGTELLAILIERRDRERSAFLGALLAYASLRIATGLVEDGYAVIPPEISIELHEDGRIVINTKLHLPPTFSFHHVVKL